MRLLKKNCKGDFMLRATNLSGREWPRGDNRGYNFWDPTPLMG